MRNPPAKEKATWFSMWFLASIASFGAAFFPMFYRLVENRNMHFRREAQLEQRIVEFLRIQGKQSPEPASLREMNAKVWTASIILIIPVFFLMYRLSKDLYIHEKHQDTFLAASFPQRMFMPQTLPIKKYALITIVTFKQVG